MICHKSDDDSVQKCVSVLKNGGIVIIPTDTVYGFSGIVDSSAHFNTDAIIRKIKGREEYKPFIQLIASPEDIKNYTDDIIPQKLLDCWPGPLTIIVNTKKNTGAGAGTGSAANTGTIALRCPGDEWLRKIISECGASIYSTSVNRSGQPVLAEENAIISEFEGEVGLIVADGDRKSSVPSTIVRVENGNYTVVRQGAIKV